jgi:CubicO group peptidase (beta-lactamase class C family)
MLSHTSGVPDTDEFFWHQPDYDDEALERYVRSLTNEEMVAAPGERYSYSNPAFDVLGDVIAKVSGESFEDYIKRHIFDPLGMHDSTFLRREVAPNLATTPHFGVPPLVLPDAYPYNRAHAPSSTLHSNAVDMGRWMLANLAHGTLDGRRILYNTTYTELWRPVAVTGEETWNEVSCLGWFRGTYRARSVVHHGGSDPGYFADKILLPDAQLGVIVMANAYSAPAWGITDAALDLLLGLEPALPQRPITVPVGAVLQAAGVDAAIAAFRRLQTTVPNAYDFDEMCFREGTESAVYQHRPDAALPLLQVWIALFPESPTAHEVLGRAYLVSGDFDAATATLQAGLALDPDSASIAKLLQKI